MCTGDKLSGETRIQLDLSLTLAPLMREARERHVRCIISLSETVILIRTQSVSPQKPAVFESC